MNSIEQTGHWTGRSSAILWEWGNGRLREYGVASRDSLHDADVRGAPAWGKPGVAVSRAGGARATLYRGELFSVIATVIQPVSPADLLALWASVSSPGFALQVKALGSSLFVTTSTVSKVPFDLEHWTKVAAEQYPDGLPEPHSDDPTQWLFKGNVPGSTAPLQVAVARLLGYRWPDQEPDDLDELADDDGIVPLPSVARRDARRTSGFERCSPAPTASAWSPALLDQLLAEAGSPGATLESWLRDDFFAQHARLFGNRPFIWHVWDGRKDGFSRPAQLPPPRPGRPSRS